MREKVVHDRIIRNISLKTVQRKVHENSAVTFSCPVLTPYLIPVIHNSTPSCINYPFMVEGDAYHLTCFSLNQKPYGALIADNIDAIDIALQGKALCKHPLFPMGADIVFVEIGHNGFLKARLYDKDNGETGFSQQGACAAFAAARILQKADPCGLVEMDGKTCRIEWDGVAGGITLIP